MSSCGPISQDGAGIVEQLWSNIAIMPPSLVDIIASDALDEEDTDEVAIDDIEMLFDNDETSV